MRWLLIGLFISMVALVVVAGAVARYVRRQRRAHSEDVVAGISDAELGLTRPEKPEEPAD
ncbi:hypothetical protein [Acidicapsa ligni]|uniref:hypothetical protein n=1 Tax=Acidicapsa ligni TaxID=542300 RepID=UPI0021E0752E|nr:hypothetical protein [Acidicapsa ligni]